MTNNKNTCDNCACNRICDHNKFGFENCNNHIAQLEKCDNTPIKNMEFCDHDVVKYLKEQIHLAEYVDSAYCDCIAVFMLKATLGLINQQQTEIERLEKVQVDYAKAFIDEYAERLKSDITIAMSSGNVPFREIIDELTETMKNEYGSYTDFTDLIVEKAIKEFEKRFENELTKIDNFYFEEEHENFISANKVIALLVNLVKEMVGDTK